MKTALFAQSRPYLSAFRLRLCGLALASIAASAACAQSADSLEQRLDSIVGEGVRESRAVGLVAAVVQGKQILLMKAVGKSSVESDASLTVDSQFPIGSTSKQFTAAEILQLRDQGKLSLDDEITKWLPDSNTHGNRTSPEPRRQLGTHPPQ